MGKFKIIETGIHDLKIIEPLVFGDQRGYFMETYNERDFAEAGLNMKFVQDNQSSSVRGVLRGLHFQFNHPQGKLVRVIKGEVFDVAVDLRKSSVTYKQGYGTILSSENRKMLYIPEGFAHGFLVMSDTAEFTYKCTDFYRPDDEGGIIWSDPEIGIMWPVEGIGEVLLSNKDKNSKYLTEIEALIKF